jgi:hypothetical protein
MQLQTVTRTAESEIEPAAIYDVLAEVTNITEWAPVFADAVERVDDARYNVTSGEESFALEVSLHPTAGTVDFIREMSGGKRGGAYVRVTPRPLGGSAITMTVPIAPNTTESEVATVVDQELAALIRLAQAGSALRLT